MTIESNTQSVTLRHWSKFPSAALLMLTLAMAAGAPALAQNKNVVARVNGTEITTADVAFASEMYANQIGSMPDDARLSVIVDELIRLQIVSDAARAARVPDEDSYKRQIAFFEAQTLRSVFLDGEVAKRVDDAAVRKAYNLQVTKNPPTEEFRLRHILLETEAEARDAIIALEEGEDFAVVASERSKDEASKVNGGDLGYLVSGQTLVEIDTAAAELEPGQFTREPVVSAFGFHLLKLEERRTRPAPPYEALATQIRAALESAATRSIMTELRVAASVEKLVPDVSPPATDDGHGHADN